MWQPPMEGEDMDEMGSGNELQQPSAAVEKKKMDENFGNESSAAEAQTTVDKVSLYLVS